MGFFVYYALMQCWVNVLFSYDLGYILDLGRQNNINNNEVERMFLDNIIGYNYTESIFGKQYKYTIMKNGDWHLDLNTVIGNSKDGLDGVFAELLHASKRRLNPYLGPNSQSLWPNGIIPIDFTTGFTGNYGFPRSLFNAVVNEFRSKTDITIIERTTENDYIQIYPGDSCSSLIGKSSFGGKQLLSLPIGCWTLAVFTRQIFLALGMIRKYIYLPSVLLGTFLCRKFFSTFKKVENNLRHRISHNIAFGFAMVVQRTQFAVLLVQ